MMRSRIFLFGVSGILTFFWLSRHFHQSQKKSFFEGGFEGGGGSRSPGTPFGCEVESLQGRRKPPFSLRKQKKTIAWLALWLCNNASCYRYVFAMPKQHSMWYEHVLCNAVQNSRTACIHRRSIHALRQCLHFTNKCKAMKRYIHANGLRMYCSANTHKSKRGMHLGS